MSADIVAADQLKAIVQRVERLEAEISDLNADKSEIYKEARANGFDVKVIKKVVSKRKIDEHEREEQDNVFDLYWNAVHGLNLVHAHARENIEQFDANPRLIKQVVDGVQTEAGRAALIAAVDIMVEREEAEEIHANPEEVGARGETVSAPAVDAGSRPVAGRSATATSEIMDVTGGESAATNPEMDRATEGSFETGSEAAEKGRKATATVAAPVDLNHAGAGESPTADQPLTGGDHEEVADSRAAKGEGDASAALPAAGVVMEYVPQSGVKRLPFASCFPDHSKAEYERLEKDIAANRVQTPIIRQGNVIIDGFARYTIARKYGFAYPVQEYTGNDLLLDLIEWQRAARNFTPAQEKKIAAELAKESPHRADDIMAAFGLAEALEDVA